MGRSSSHRKRRHHGKILVKFWARKRSRGIKKKHRSHKRKHRR